MYIYICIYRYIYHPQQHIHAPFFKGSFVEKLRVMENMQVLPETARRVSVAESVKLRVSVVESVELKVNVFESVELKVSEYLRVSSWQ